MGLGLIGLEFVYVLGSRVEGVLLALFTETISKDSVSCTSLSCLFFCVFGQAYGQHNP